MKGKIIVITVILLTGLAGWAVMQKKSQQQAVQATVSAPLVSVDVVQPVRKTLFRTVEVYGSLSPKITTLVKSEQPGKIFKIRVKEWDRIKPGDVLLEMDAADHRLAVSRSQAGLKMAEAQVMQTEADLNRANREWRRAQSLKEGGLITSQELDERQTAVELAEAQASLAKAQVGQEKVRVAEAGRSLEKTTVVSPIHGTVSERIVDVGDFVDTGGPLFSIVDNRILDFTATVSATELALVTEGQPLTFTVDGFPDKTFQGFIKRINPMVSSVDRSIKIIAEVKNTDEILKGGLYAKGFIVVEKRQNVLTVPKSALMSWDMLKHTAMIFEIDSAYRAFRKPLETGLIHEDSIEITAGLSETDHVVIRGGFNLKDGDKVQIVNPVDPKQTDAPNSTEAVN